MHTIETLIPILRYAAAWNKLDASALEPILAPEVEYESQWVFAALVGRAAVLEYFTGKFDTLRKSGPGSEVRMELGITTVGPQTGEACLVVFQADAPEPVATVVIKVTGGVIGRIDLCMVPDPRAVHRTGIVPH